MSINKFTNVYKRGFTLIELLVVIAIIGILSSIVMSSLNQARNKGANSAIKSNLANLRSQAEIFYDATVAEGGGNQSYSGLCAGALSISIKFRQGVVAAVGASLSPSTAPSYLSTSDQTSAVPQPSNTTVCHANSTGWAVSVPLKIAETGGILYWCVDYTGFSGGRVKGVDDVDDPLSGTYQYKCATS